MAKDVKGRDGLSSRRLLDKARALLDANCQARPLEAIHWESRAHLEKDCGSSADVRACLQAQLAAYRKHSAWRTDPSALDAVSEVAAQLVEAKLDAGEPELFREAKQLVNTLLHEASEKLAATAGCENLRMLQARITRHDDDD